MSWKEELVNMMRSSPETSKIKLAKMTGADTCKVGSMELGADDMLFNDRLQATAKVEGDTLVLNMRESVQSGDTVAVYQVSDSQFLVLGRMVKTS